MADDNEDLIITIDDDQKAAEPAVENPTEAAQDELKAQYEQELQKRETAQAERDEARRRESEAHARAEQARRDAASARGEATDTQLSAVTTALNAVESEASTAEVDLQNALEKADYAAVAKAQRRIAQAESRLTQLNQAKEFFEGQRNRPQQQQPPADPVEAFIQSRTQPTADWLRSHRDWVADPAKSQKLTQAHYHALGEGLRTDTPEYFAHVEQRLGLREAPVEEKAPAAPAAPKVTIRKAAPPVASVNGSSSSSGSAASEVRLTKNEAASATDGTHVWNYDDPSPQKRWKKGEPIGVEEFARRKRELQKRGAYDPMNFMATT